MNNKIIITTLCVSLFGCANLKYPNWQSVNVVDSAYQQPCKKVGTEECSGDRCENNIDWFKKRATKFDGNNVIININKDDGSLKSASYFYCAAGIAPYTDELPPLYIIRNKFNPTATTLDYEKADAECEYDAHRSTIDTRVPEHTRPYVYGAGLENSLSQLSAIETDNINKMHHAYTMRKEKGKLYNECMNSKGFKSTLTTDKKDLADADKYCPDKTSFIRYCFISEAK